MLKLLRHSKFPLFVESGSENSPELKKKWMISILAARLQVAKNVIRYFRIYLFVKL